MNDDLKKLYEAISTKFDVGSFDDFSAKMETEDMRKSFYDTVSGKGIDLGDYEQYESRLKKKDSSMPQGASAQVDTEVSPSVSEDGQSSLEQDVQASLEERLASYDGVSNEEKIKIARQEDQRPFFEAQGLNYDDFLSAKSKEEEVESTRKTQEEKDDQASWAEKWYDRFSNWSEYNQEQTELAEKDATSKLYLSGNEEKIKAAKTEYDNALFQSIAKSSQSPEEFSKALEDSDIDSHNIRMSAMTIDGKEASINESLDYWMKTDNVNAAQDGESVNFSITVPDPSDPSYEAIKYVEDFMNRQIDSGGRFGDWGQNLLATTIDLGAGFLEQLEKAPAALGMKPSPLTDSEEFEDLSAWDLYMQEGGYYANKVSDYAENIREKTRIPEESSITKAIFDGNFDDAFFNTGNGIANAVPFTLSIALAGGGTVPLILGGASAGGMKSLELKERRRKGEDIKDWQIHFSEGVTAVSEAFFEKYTQGIINSARTAGGFKAIKDPNILLDSYFQGIKKSMFIEGSSEVATEASQYLADAIPAVGLEEFDSGEFAIRMVDTGIISTLFGGLTYTTVRGAKDISRNLNIINDNTSVIFTNEKGETREVSRGEAINLAKDPEVAQQIRDGKLKVDYSVSDVARQAIDDLVYGHSAPDAQQAKAKMFEKEKAVSSLSRKINQAKEDAKASKEDYEVSMEDVSSLASAISEMEVEGKKSKYNVTESTRAARAESKKILDDNNIEIVDAVESQNTSVSKVTETVDATKIDSQEQYDAVKKQLEDGKRKPTVVQSQNQSGIKVNGEVSQTSEITQGKFKSVSAARNAMKDFEAKRDAAKRGEMLESDLSYANNKLFINTKKQNLDEIPQEVIDNNDYHVLTSEKEGLTEQERVSRMESLKSMLDEAGATYYTVQGVYNGVAEESLVVTGIDNATALNLGNQFQQESIFSSKDGLMFGDGRVVPLDGDMVKGPDARKRDTLTIMNVGGRKVSIHSGLNRLKTSYGKNFNSDNIHKLDESDPNHDSEVFQGLTKDRKRALGFAFKLLSSIGGLNVTVIRNSKAMEEQLKAIGQDPSKKMGSFFRGADKTIYVNLETARGNTLFHEIIHPMVDFIKKSDPALYNRIEAEVKESGVKRRVMKNGRRMKGSYLDWAKTNYEGLSEEGLIEEAFAEMMGDAAYGHFVNSQSKLSRIREVIKAMLSRLGITSPFENVEAIDLNQMSLSNLRTDLAEALVNGRKINVGGVEFEVGDIQADKDKVNESIKFQVDKLENNSDLGVVNINIPDNTQTQEIRFQTPEFYPNFDVSKVKRGSIKEFNGQKALLMLTDRSASGMVVSPTGVKHEFDGGVFYPYQEDTGVWAFSDKAAATRMINAARESDGLVFLTAMAPGSIDGSVNMFDYVMKELDQAIKDKRATKKEVVEFLNKKMTIKSFDSKAKDQGIKTSKIKSVKEFSNLVLSMPQAFGVRKDIIRKSIQSKIFEKWGIPSMQEIYNTVNQDIIKDLKGNPIVSAIKIDTEAGYVDSRLDDKIKDHPTYPYVVKGEPLMIFDESVDASEVWGELNLADKFLIDSRTGEKLSEGQTQSRRQRKIEMARPVVDIRMQAPTYDMEYTPNSLISLSMLSDNNRQPEQWVKEIGKGVKGASKDVDTMGLLDLLKAYKKEAKVKSIPKEVVAQLIATNMAQIETNILDKTIVQYPGAVLPGGENYREFLINDKSPETIFSAPHYFGLPYASKNLIASARVDDRVGPNGEKILFVQEIQSDWAQRAADKKKSGEKLGFKKDNPPLTKEEGNEMGDLSAIYNRAINEQVKGIKDPWVENLLFESGGYRIFELLERVNERMSNSKPTEDLKNYQRYLQLQMKDARFEDAVVDLPWNQTDLWVGLTIRKLINQASKEGYDQIAFVNGEQSDRVQGHTDGRTAEFYDKIIPKNINKELDRLVKGSKFEVGSIDEAVVNYTLADFEVTSSSELENGNIQSVFTLETSMDRGDQVSFTVLYKNEEFADAGAPFEYELEYKGKQKKYTTSPALQNEILSLVNAKQSIVDQAMGDLAGMMGSVLRAKNQNAVINLTPELKAATDKVGPLRFQAPQEEGEANVYTSGLTTIAWDIADAVIKADYAAGKYLSKILSKTGADKGKGYKVRLSQLLGKSIGEHSNAEVKEIMVLSRGNLNAEILRVSENSKDLQKALEGTDFTSDQINDLLHNMDEIRSMEDSEIKSILVDMRMHIDQLSRTLIEEEMIEGSTMFTVDENMGVYVRRSYKQFEAKGWEQTDNDIIKKAKEFLYKEAKKENPTATIKELNNIVGKNYKKLTEDKEFLYNIKNSTSLDGLNRVNSIFKEKKVIPEEIRDLWGQIDNPLFNYSNTAIKLAKTVSAERMYRDIYDIGKGKFISDSFQLEVTENELKGSKWGSLEGKFVDEEMFAVMNQVVENKNGNELLNFYMKIVLFNKKMSTVWNPGTHFKNVVGNTAFATMNGHIGFRGEMYKDAKTAFNTVRSLKDPELKAFYSKLVKLGVVNSSASLQEIRGIANDVYDSNFDLSEYLDEGRGYVAKRMAKLSRGAKGNIKKIDDRLMSLYQKEDDVWKAFGFMSEKARYIKAGLDVNLAEQMAAKNIRNLYPNYNEVPRIIRLLGRNALVGSFVAFQAESVRNSKNALALGFEEMGSNNSKIKKIGATRIAGTIATMTLMESLQLYTIQLLGGAIGSLLAGFGFGEDDEEVEDRMMRTVMPEWDASGNIALTSRGELESMQTEGQTQGDKYFDYINFSNVSGVGYIKDIMRLMFNDLNTNIGKESMLDILEKVYAPFLGQEMTLTVMMDAINNKGNKVYNPTDDIHMQIASIISYVGSEIGPGFVRSGLRIKDSMDADSDKVPVYETLAFFGLRVNRINVNKNMSIQTYYVYKDMIDRVGYEVLKDEDMLINTANPEGSTYDSKMDDYINSLVDVYGVGILNSIEGDDILSIFRNSRISEEVIKLVDQRAKSRYQEDYINVEAK